MTRQTDEQRRVEEITMMVKELNTPSVVKKLREAIAKKEGGCVKPVYPEYKCMTHYMPRRRKRKGETITCSIRDEEERSC